MLVCPGCRESQALRLAHLTGRFDGFLRLFRSYPYRCELCQTRFRRFGRQKLEAVSLEPLPAMVADPTAFKTLRFEGENSLPKSMREPAPARAEADARPKPVLLARTREAPIPEGASLFNPLAMVPVEFEPGERPVRAAEHERFDPLVLGEQVAADEAPLRAEGDHTFDPLAMENRVFDRANLVNSLPSRLHGTFEARAAARRERREFFASEEGRRVLSAWRKRRRWILWSGLAIQAASGVPWWMLYHAEGAGGLESKALWLGVGAAYLISGTVLALIYPRFNAEQKNLRPRFADLMTGWVGFVVCFDFAAFVVLFPYLAGGSLNFGFYRTGGVWLWIAYASVAAAAGIGWIASLLPPRAKPVAG